jgi:hypothetical protein
LKKGPLKLENLGSGYLFIDIREAWLLVYHPVLDEARSMHRPKICPCMFVVSARVPVRDLPWPVSDRLAGIKRMVRANCD